MKVFNKTKFYLLIIALAFTLQSCSNDLLIENISEKFVGAPFDAGSDKTKATIDTAAKAATDTATKAAIDATAKAATDATATPSLPILKYVQGRELSPDYNSFATLFAKLSESPLLITKRYRISYYGINPVGSISVSVSKRTAKYPSATSFYLEYVQTKPSSPKSSHLLTLKDSSQPRLDDPDQTPIYLFYLSSSLDQDPNIGRGILFPYGAVIIGKKVFSDTVLETSFGGVYSLETKIFNLATDKSTFKTLTSTGYKTAGKNSGYYVETTASNGVTASLDDKATFFQLTFKSGIADTTVDSNTYKLPSSLIITQFGLNTVNYTSVLPDDSIDIILQKVRVDTSTYQYIPSFNHEIVGSNNTLNAVSGFILKQANLSGSFYGTADNLFIAGSYRYLVVQPATGMNTHYWGVYLLRN